MGLLRPKVVFHKKHWNRRIVKKFLWLPKELPDSKGHLVSKWFQSCEVVQQIHDIRDSWNTYGAEWVDIQWFEGSVS